MVTSWGPGKRVSQMHKPCESGALVPSWRMVQNIRLRGELYLGTLHVTATAWQPFEIYEARFNSDGDHRDSPDLPYNTRGT